MMISLFCDVSVLDTNGGGVGARVLSLLSAHTGNATTSVCTHSRLIPFTSFVRAFGNEGRHRSSL